MDGIATVEPFKKGSEGVRTRWTKQEYVINKPQPKCIELGIKEILLKVAHEQVSIGGGHMGAHGCALDLEVMVGIEGDAVVGKDKLSWTRN